jgi:hypothetical protein
MRRPSTPSLAAPCALAAAIVAGGVGSYAATRGAEAESAPCHERIDRALQQQDGGLASPTASEATLLRRLYCDLVGRPPTEQEARQYLADVASAAVDATPPRVALIDDLLDREEFSDYWAQVADVMLMERRPDKRIPADAWRSFLREWIAARRPLDALYRELLSSDGSLDETRSAAKFLLDRDVEPNVVTRDVGRIVFGRDLQCAQCHDHPLVADYLQSEYYGIQFFLHRTHLFEDAARGNRPLLGEKAEGELEFFSAFDDDEEKAAAQPVLPTSMAMDIEPSFAAAEQVYLAAPAQGTRSIPRFSLRHQLAVLATHPKNEAFNRNLANRLWAQMLGRGVVSPVDRHHADNPPVSAELLDVLARQLVASRYDLRAFLRQVALSAAYQRAAEEPGVEFWSGPGFDAELAASQLADLADEIARLEQEDRQWHDRAASARESVREAQADFLAAKQAAQTAHEHLTAALERRAAAEQRLAATQAELQRGKDLAGPLAAAVQETDKALGLVDEPGELPAAKETLLKRLEAARNEIGRLENAEKEHAAAVAAAAQACDSAQGTSAGLGSRQLAYAEFVAEARGVERSVQAARQQTADRLGDLRRRSTLAELRQAYAQQLAADDVPAQAVDEAREELSAAWVAHFGLRAPRPMSPEQLAHAMFTGLALEGVFRSQAEQQWEQAHPDPARRPTAEQRAEQIETAYQSLRTGLEQRFAGGFGAPPGTPQDVFFAAADQALFLANDPVVQQWLVAEHGSLVARLLETPDEQLPATLFLALLSRFPSDDEQAAVQSLLAAGNDARLEVVQDLVWGVLASAEFRFIP